MKKIITTILAALMLLFLAACGAGAAEPTLSPEEQAFEAACALLEEGKYQEAYAAFTTLESYRRIQEKIDEAAAGIEAERLAEEEAAKQALLQQVGFLYGTTWRDTRSTAELTFGECQETDTGSFSGEVHYLDWIDSTTKREADYLWTMTAGEIYIPYLPVLGRENIPEEGFLITVEEQNGVIHLLVGECDFVRTEDYSPYEPTAVEITIDNWQEYFEIKEGLEWEYDDFGVCDGVRIITAICLKEAYQDRLILDRTNVTFGCTCDFNVRSVEQIDFENKLAVVGEIRDVLEQGLSFTNVFCSNHYDTRKDNTVIAELPQVFMELGNSSYYEPAHMHSPHCFLSYENHVIDRVAGTLVLRPE